MTHLIALKVNKWTEFCFDMFLKYIECLPFG